MNHVHSVDSVVDSTVRQGSVLERHAGAPDNSLTSIFWADQEFTLR